MSHRPSPICFHTLIRAVLAGFALAVLASCSPSPDSQSPLPSSNSGRALDSDGGSAAVPPDVAENSDSSPDTVPVDTPDDSAEPSEERSESGPIASESQPEDSSVEGASPPEADRLDAEAEPAQVAANVESSDPAADFSSESAGDGDAVDGRPDEGSEDIGVPEEDRDAVSDSNGLEPSGEAISEDATSGDVISDDTVSESDIDVAVEDRAWQLVQNRGRLRVGLDPTIGYTYLRANPERRTVEGFEWDILQAIARELNVEIEPVYIPWDDQLAALESNSVDLVLGGRDALGMDATRFTPTLPYYSSPQRIVVRDDLSDEIQHLSDLFGQKVGTVADSAGAAVVEVFNRDRANALTLRSSPNPSQLFQQLRQLEVDAIVIDQPVAVAEAERVVAIAREEGDLDVDDEARPSIPDEPAVTEASPPEGLEPEADSVLDASAFTENEPSIEIEPVVASPFLSEEPAGGDISEADAAIEGNSTEDELIDPESELEDAATEGAGTEDSDTEVSLYIVGEPMFPTALVGVVKTEHTSIKQAIDEAIATLEQNGTLTTILEKWEL
ncbi:MAG: transporter substrate-binding domain-containing protein [Cyanobacteria bacterium J06597_1]